MKFTKAILLAGVVPGFAHAGEPSAKGAIEIPAQTSRWTFGASFAPLLNVDADFSSLGAYASPFALRPTGGGQDYEYENGFVRVDGSGNAGGVTSYWGYDDAAQYDPAGGGSLSFNLTSGARNGRVGASEDFSPGFEFFGYLDMGRIADFSGRPVSWGFKTGLHYARISIGNSSTLTSDVIQVTDTFDASGILLIPAAGYSGPYSGAGPLLGDSPTRVTNVIAGGATVAGDRDLDLDMITLSAGPYIRIPVADNFSVLAEAGLSLSVARGEYDFESVTTIAPLGTQTTGGDDTRTSLLPGVYAGFSAIWQLTERFGIHGSARYQYIDQFDIGANGTEASLSFDGSAVISLGGIWTF